MAFAAVPDITLIVRGRLGDPQPCPWCNGTEVRVQSDSAACWIVCQHAVCRACGPRAGTPTEAYEAWQSCMLRREQGAP